MISFLLLKMDVIDESYQAMTITFTIISGILFIFNIVPLLLVRSYFNELLKIKEQTANATGNDINDVEEKLQDPSEPHPQQQDHAREQY